MSRGSYVDDTNAFADYHNTGHYLVTGGTTSGQTSWAVVGTPSITIASSGGNVKHENRMPYEVVFRWKRTV
nr:MAG TPA: Baseplate structural protein [Caudoviricetes sp.]